MSVAELVAVVLAVAYLLLAIRQNIWCWAAALCSSVIYLWLFFDARLYMESALQIFYVAMAVYGWHQWKHGGDDGRGLHIVTWRFRTHALVISGVLILSVGVGWAMTATDAVFPYLDSFTTVAAVVTTYMVARKILENWVYWFVIDSVAIYLYIARELYLTSALFVAYLVLVIVGFRRWRRDWRAETAAEA